MASSFPSSLDAFTNPTSADALDSVSVPHATQHSDLNDAVEALEAKVGADSSGVVSSHDYKIAQLEAAVGDIAIFNETQSSGTAGGTSTNTFTKRTLNTTVVNNITGCSIASSVITLPAGTYHIIARAPARNSNGHKIRLANTTDSTYVYGTSAQTFTTGNVDTDSNLNTVITIAASKNFEIQHTVAATAATFGFGSACSFGVDEKFSEIMIRRIA